MVSCCYVTQEVITKEMRVTYAMTVWVFWICVADLKSKR